MNEKADAIDNLLTDLELDLDVDEKGKLYYSEIARKLMNVRIEVKKIFKQ